MAPFFVFDTGKLLATRPSYYCACARARAIRSAAARYPTQLIRWSSAITVILLSSSSAADGRRFTNREIFDLVERKPMAALVDDEPP